MPELERPDKESKDNRRFMREKIVKQPMSRKQIWQRMVVFFFIAIFCGGAAGISFAIARPVAEKYLLPETTKETIPITIPKDELETTVPQTSETAQSQETEPIEDILQSAMEKYQYSVGDLDSMYSSLHSIAQKADKGIVTVHSVKQQTDWFDNPVESSGQYAGVIIASTRLETLILTPKSAVESADSIRVAFDDAFEATGTIKQIDHVAELAIVSVDTTTLSESVARAITPVELGNSYGVKQGDIVIAIGSPAGMNHSTCYGDISYIMRNVQLIDRMTRLFYVNMQSDASTGAFLINTNGALIGWITDEFNSDVHTEHMTVVQSISDYKTILEKMTNGSQAPYFGIRGQEVSTEMESKGIPRGVYIVNCVTDGPAYNAGIQNGDIIIQIQDKDIFTMNDYQKQLNSLHTDDVVKVKICREGIEEYKELEYEVTIGAR